MLPLISVIVPVYNTGKYIDRCLKSIINQTYQNLEIILVDDGSTDDSPEKCDQYALLDSRIRVVHTKNGGPSSARNAGLDICNGAYIGFVDSDDWIEPEMYASLLELIVKYDADLAVARRCDAYEDAQYKTVEKEFGKDGPFSAHELLPQMLLGKLSDFSVCDKLHRRELWESRRFPEGVIYEDFAALSRVIMTANTIVLYDKPLYIYYHHKNSIVTSGFREALKDYPQHTKEFLQEITVKYPEYTHHAIWGHIKAIQYVLISLLRSDRKTYVAYSDLYNTYIQEIKEYRNVWQKAPMFSSIDRLICRIVLHKGCARLFFRLKKKR